MATVATTTVADGLGAPGVASIARRYVNATTDYLYAAVRTAADTLAVYVSTNSGGSWASLTSFTHTGLQEWSSLVYESDFLHVAYRVGTASVDTIHYRRYQISTNGWSAALQTSGSDANGGVIGSRWQGVDLLVRRHNDGAYAILIAGHYADTTPRYGLLIMGVGITTSGTIYSNNGLISGTRSWYVSGTNLGRSGVVMEAEHVGDGTTSQIPNAWVCWGRTTLRMVKLAWQPSTAGWSGPSSAVTVRDGLPTAQDYAAGRWDGTQWVMAVPSPDSTSVVRLYQRDRANTVQSSYDSPAHPNGVVRFIALSYDLINLNPRVFAVGTSANTLYYVDYNRANNTWSAWTQVSASVLANSGAEFGTKRGGAANARHDIVYSITGSPNTVTHVQQSTSAAPKTAVWSTTGQAYTNGSAANVGATLPLAWSFSDIDPGASQGSYALSRQIGAGSVSYWNATTSTWGASEVQNTSSTQGVTLPSAWGVDGDSAHQYKVKVWDNTGIAAPGYSNPLTLYPSAQVNPTVSAPTAGQVINNDTLTTTWTTAEQTGARIVLTQTSPAVAAAVYDSGPMMGYTATSYTIPYALQNGYAYTVAVYTYNLDGLASAAVTRNITVSYAPPPPMVSAYTPSANLGYIIVAGTAPTPVGVQPSILSADLYRRPNTTPTLNGNPTFAGSTTGYAIGGTGGGALTYSTAQTPPGATAGAGRYVPSGASATPAVESTPVTIDATRQVYACAWVRPDTGNKPVTLAINWYTSGGVYLSSVTVTLAAPIATAWQWLEVVGDPTGVATAAKASVSVGLTGTPAASDAIYVDDMRLRAYDPTTPVPVSKGALPPATVNDWRTTSGVDYEYRWVAKGSTGTTVYGPWMS